MKALLLCLLLFAQLLLRAEPLVGMAEAEFHAKFPSPVKKGENEEMFEKDRLKILVAFWRGRVSSIMYNRDTEFTTEEVDRFLRNNALKGEDWERRRDIPGRKWESPSLGAIWYEERDQIVKPGMGAIVIASRERMLWLSKSPLGMGQEEVVEKYGKPISFPVQAPAEKALSFIWDDMVVAVQIWKGKVAYVMFKRPVGQPFTMEKQKLVMGINGDWQFKSNGDGHAWFCKSAVAAYLHGQNVMALQTAEYYKAHGAAEAVKDAPSAK